MSTNSKKNKDYLAEPINSHSQNWKNNVWEVVMNSSLFPYDILVADHLPISIITLATFC